MKRFLIIVAAALLTAWGWSQEARAGHYGSLKGYIVAGRTSAYPWHGGYYDAAWGVPVVVLVPPTAESQTHYSWGVGGFRVTPIDHQFQRDYPGPGVYPRGAFLPTPPWPSSTDQFGDYYVRGPW